MNLRTAGVLLLLCICTGRIYGDVKSAQIERELVAVLEWEIMWGQTPAGFQVPIGHSVHLAVNISSDSVAYCSHDLRVCEKYRTFNFRNWQEVGSRKCQDAERDQDSVLAFVGLAPARSAKDRTELTLRAGGLSGQPRAASGITWASDLTLRSQAEIAENYKHLHPQQLSSLQSWLRTTLSTAGYNSITIACFAPSDPEVFLYGIRPGEGPIFMSVFWNAEAAEWQTAGILEGEQNRKRLDELGKIISSRACSTVNFQ